MAQIEIQRNHDGKMYLFVGGQIASGARITGTVTDNDGGVSFVALLPAKDVTLAEVRNVVPFVRPPL